VAQFQPEWVAQFGRNTQQRQLYTSSVVNKGLKSLKFADLVYEEYDEKNRYHRLSEPFLYRWVK